MLESGYQAYLRWFPANLVLANFVLAMIIFTVINMVSGKDMTPAVIEEVQVDSPAFVAGMKKNDKIVSINNRKVENYATQMNYRLMNGKGIMFYIVVLQCL